MIYQLFLIDFRTLEEEMERHKEDPFLRQINFPDELNRKKSIEEDLLFYSGEDWMDQIKESYSTKAYVDRIR